MSIFDYQDIELDVSDSDELTQQQKEDLAKTFYFGDMTYIEKDKKLCEVFARKLKSDMKDNPEMSISNDVLKVLFRHGIHL